MRSNIPKKKGEARTSVMMEAIWMVFGGIVIIAIFVVLGNIIMGIFGSAEKSEILSLNVLVDEINKLEDGEMYQVPVFLSSEAPNNFVMFGFEEGVDELTGGIKAEGYGKQYDILNDKLPKPTTKCGDKSCLCVYDVGKNPLPGIRYEMFTNGDITCENTKYNLKAGQFDIRRDYVVKKGFKSFSDWLLNVNPTDKVTMISNFAFVPDIGMAIVTIIRDGNDVYMCWGDNCQVPVKCEFFNFETCNKNNNGCYPTFDNDGKFLRCYDCPSSNFECDDIKSSKCDPGTDCAEACDKNFCGTKCSYDSSARECKSYCIGIDKDECFDNQEYCYPSFFFDGSFLRCSECPNTDLECSDIRSLQCSKSTDCAEACVENFCGTKCIYDETYGTCGDYCSTLDKDTCIAESGCYPYYERTYTVSYPHHHDSFVECKTCKSTFDCDDISDQTCFESECKDVCTNNPCGHNCRLASPDQLGGTDCENDI